VSADYLTVQMEMDQTTEHDALALLIVVLQTFPGARVTAFGMLLAGGGKYDLRMRAELPFSDVRVRLLEDTHV
jgi:hypothetical protein